MKRTGHSLRRRLVLLLLASVIIVACIQALFAYRGALVQADEAFDYQMRQLALAFRADANDAASARHSLEIEGLDFVVQVWTEDGRRIYQSTTRRFVPASPDPGYSVVRTGDSTWRVYALRNRGRFVQVAQDLDARAAQARSMALASAAPILALVPLLMGLVWWAVTQSLAPVHQVRAELASRAANDLTPVAEPGLPAELRPLVHEFNALLHRVGQAFEAQQHFVADAAHELRSPLAALRVQLRNLRTAGDQGKRDDALLMLEQGVNRATRLIDQLMALARQEAAAAADSPLQSVNLAEAVRGVVGQMTTAAQARDIDLGATRCDEAQIQASPDAVQILLRNLLENAIKYTPHGGSVDVGIEADQQSVLLTVEDSGPGIDPAERDRVLDRFYRVSGVPAGDEAIDGSGLGLAIVHAITKRLGAQLELARSPRLGGLRISVRFPL